MGFDFKSSWSLPFYILHCILGTAYERQSVFLSFRCLILLDLRKRTKKFFMSMLMPNQRFFHQDGVFCIFQISNELTSAASHYRLSHDKGTRRTNGSNKGWYYENPPLPDGIQIRMDQMIQMHC